MEILIQCDCSIMMNNNYESKITICVRLRHLDDGNKLIIEATHKELKLFNKRELKN